MYLKRMAATDAPCQVSIKSLDELSDMWRVYKATLQWSCPFVLPLWLKAWWKVFGNSCAKPLIAVVQHGAAIIGIAPLMAKDKTVRFMGDPEICDYFDCIVAEDMEELFFTPLVAELFERGIEKVELGPVRPDSSTHKFFLEYQLPQAIECRVSSGGMLLEYSLPNSWDDFLQYLGGKQRHELRRKLRRLDRAGAVQFRRIDDVAQLSEGLETFLDLFTMNREEKVTFMTHPMATFFRELAFALAEEGLLRLFLLNVDDQPAASVFCFDHLGTRYLYNNGYDEAFSDLSVGLISKVFSIKTAIDDGVRAYSFLKGNELYKRRLGGMEIPLSLCHLRLH